MPAVGDVVKEREGSQRSAPPLGGPLGTRVVLAAGVRLALLIFALGALVWVNFRRGFDSSPMEPSVALVTLAVAFAATALYTTAVRLGWGPGWVADAQLVVDQLVWTVLVYLTGGVRSGAVALYGLTCLLGVYLTAQRGAAIAAGAGAAAYVVISLALFRGWLRPPAGAAEAVYAVTPDELVYHIGVNLLVLLVVTLLALNLAERLRAAAGELFVAEGRAARAERLAALGRLAAGLAHEIRNPLGAIAGSAAMLGASADLPEDDRQLCEIIRSEAGRLEELVVNMLQLSKVQPPVCLPIDVARLSAEVVQLAASSGRAGRDVPLRYDGPPALTVSADAAQLRQVLWNLLRNAVEASSPGQEVVLRLRDDPDRGPLLEVSDQGPGLTPEAVERIFDAFVTTRSQGSGIGLAVVKRIVDDHDFGIEVETAAGSGALFRILLTRQATAAGDGVAKPLAWGPPRDSADG